MEVKREIASRVAESVSAKLTYGGAGTAIIFGMTANEVAALGGLILGIVALIVNTGINIYYKQKQLEIQRKRDNCK